MPTYLNNTKKLALPVGVASDKNPFLLKQNSRRRMRQSARSRMECISAPLQLLDRIAFSVAT